MRIVVAPDSFKGTIDAADAAEALASGWRSVRSADEVRCVPMADGGEGTLSAIVSASPGARLVDVPDVAGPDGRPVRGQFALLPNGTAVVELAVASGLPLLGVKLRPLTATTRGTGETIAAALDAGATPAADRPRRFGVHRRRLRTAVRTRRPPAGRRRQRHH